MKPVLVEVPTRSNKMAFGLRMINNPLVGWTFFADLRDFLDFLLIEVGIRYWTKGGWALSKADVLAL